MAQLGSTLIEWASVVGEEHVVVAPDRRAEAETATFVTTQSVPAIIRPANREEVQECLRIANRDGIPVYPVSSGKNWGYGSRVPAESGSVLLDLGRMNRIVDFDEDLAYVTVEPGVTQQQLFDFLQSRNSQLWMDASGSSPNCSLVGNVMERGFGHTPYGDHFSHICGMEVVLPNGECISTGLARFSNAKAASLYRWGIGPSLDGLFSQSNLGIVTRMTIWLMPKPQYFEAFFFRCDQEQDLAPALDALRPLRLNGTLRSAIHIGNDYKILGGIQQYPWDAMGGRTPLSAECLANLRQKLNFGAWNGSGGLYGTPKQVAEAKRLVKEALAGKVGKLQFLNDSKLRMASRFAGAYRLMTGWDLTRALELVRPVLGLMQGVPTAQPLAGAYWRKRMPAPADPHPDRDRCGLLWCAPIVPLHGKQAMELTKLVRETMLSHGFEPMISLTMITERAMASVVSIIYDRDVPGEDERAMECYLKLMDSLHEHGYYSYRLGIQSMAEMNRPAGYQHLLQTIKSAVDPNGILAPKRYQVCNGGEPRFAPGRPVANRSTRGDDDGHGFASR